MVVEDRCNNVVRQWRDGNGGWFRSSTGSGTFAGSGRTDAADASQPATRGGAVVCGPYLAVCRKTGPGPARNPRVCDLPAEAAQNHSPRAQALDRHSPVLPPLSVRRPRFEPRPLAQRQWHVRRVAPGHGRRPALPRPAGHRRNDAGRRRRRGPPRPAARSEDRRVGTPRGGPVCRASSRCSSAWTIPAACGCCSICSAGKCR